MSIHIYSMSEDELVLDEIERCGRQTLEDARPCRECQVLYDFDFNNRERICYWCRQAFTNIEAFMTGVFNV